MRQPIIYEGKNYNVFYDENNMIIKITVINEHEEQLDKSKKEDKKIYLKVGTLFYSSQKKYPYLR